MRSILKTEETDQALVRAALQSPDAFGAIIDGYQVHLRRYVTRLGCRNKEDADDLLQEIFLKVYINLNEYDERLKFSSWMYRIAHNETVSFFRKQSVRPSPVRTEEELKLFDTMADNTDIAELLDGETNAQQVYDALSRIEEQYRNVLVLKFLEDKSYDEISDILKIPMGTVATLIHRGKKKLKEVMISKNMNI